MKKILLIIGIVLIPICYAQGVPQDTDASREQLIIQEHKNTRKFMSDELTRQRNEFFKEMQDRAEEYETKANIMVSDAVWKLGLMWAGTTLFVVGVLGFIGRRLDKRKWNKMLDSAKAQLQEEKTKQQAKIDQEKQSVQQQADALAQARPKLLAMHQKMAQDKAELEKVMKELGVGGR